jgi:predicted lipoprotein with Yx(FWY)xxD motif
MTLYRLSGEAAGKFICTSKECLAVWHPLATASGAKLTGAPSLSTVQRPDGSQQVTYKGQPLYTFASDKQPGQTSGEGIKDVGTWNTLKVAGAPSEAASTEPSPAPAAAGSSGAGEEKSSGGGGYAY